MFHWTIHVKGRVHREDQAAVVVGHKLYCFGGRGDQTKRDHIEVLVFNTVSLCWKRLTPVTPGRGERHLEVPYRLYGSTAVLIGDTVYIWGGSPQLHGGSDYCNVLHAFDVDTHRWFKPQVSGTVPEGKGSHLACVLGKVMYIYGGETKKYYYTEDIYKLDTSTMVWALIYTRGTRPHGWEYRSATIIRKNMFVFGGYKCQWYNSIGVFDTVTNCWLDTPSVFSRPHPEGRCHYSAFTYNGELYIFGGLHNLDPANDLWKLSPETFCWKKVEPKGKGPGPMSGMCCCMVGDRTFLFGGDNSPDDLYVLDFSPSLKTLCKLAVIQYGLEQSELPHNIRWELAAMNTNSNREITAL